MEIKDLTAILVVAMVGCILVAGFIPVMGEVTTANATIKNIGAYYMTDQEEDYTLIYDPVNSQLVINDKPLLWTNIPAMEYTLISTDEFIIRFSNSGNHQLSLVTTSAFAVLSGDGATVNTTLECDNGSLNYTGAYNPWTRTYEPDTFRGIVADNTGNYVMTNGTDKPILSGESSIIIGHGTTNVTHWYDKFYIEGTINDGVTVTAPEGITVSDINVNATEIKKYLDGFEFENITFTATDGDNVVNATYNRVIVPAEVTLEKSVHADADTASIITMIPFILIVGIVVMFVGVVLVRRYV